MNDLEHRLPSINYILKKISDDKALTLFNHIAISDGDTDISSREMSLTTKQYYSRISGLMNAGLIKRYRGKYFLTLLGKIVYESQVIVREALACYWKLKTIETIEMSSGAPLPEGELTQLINALIGNHQIKDILMRSISIETISSESNSENFLSILKEKSALMPREDVTAGKNTT